MTAYTVSKFLFELNDPRQRDALLADPAKQIAACECLSDSERTALIDRDVVYLQKLGVSIYLIRTLELIGGSGIVETGMKFGGLGPRIVSDSTSPGVS